MQKDKLLVKIYYQNKASHDNLLHLADYDQGIWIAENDALSR